MIGREGRSRLADLEKDQRRVQEEQERVREEQAAHAAHLERVLAQFSHEVQKVEDLQKNAIAAASAHMITAPQSTVTVAGSHPSTKINKPPVLPSFSGSDPIPKDEGSYEQWKFQVSGALKVCTEEAVRSAIVRSVRGEVRKMISFLGFDGGPHRHPQEGRKAFWQTIVWGSSPTGILSAFTRKV